MKLNLSKISNLYDENVDKYGLDVKSVGWGTKDKQYLRFRKLTDIIENNQKNLSINELGCGYGELVVYLMSRSFDLRKYYGYDISKKMLDLAKKHLMENIKVDKTFVCSSQISTIADFTIASGIFNVKFNEEKDRWDQYILETLNHMFKYSKKGIAFNFLTKYVDWEEDNLYYANPSYYFEFCKNKLSKKVSLVHDYDLYEFTIHVLK